MAEKIYQVLYAKSGPKKKKSYEDGKLIMKAKSTAILLDDTEKVVARMMISRSDIIEEHTEVTLGRFEIQVEGLIDTLTGNNENETQLKSSVLGAPNVASNIDSSSSSSDTRAPLHPIGRMKAFVQPDRLGSAAARVSAFRPPASSSSSSSRAGIKHKTSPPQMNNGNKRARVLGSDDSDGGEDEDENEGELIWTSMVVAGAPLVPSPPPPAKPIVAVPFIAPGSALVNEGIATGASASSSASSSAMDVGPPRLDPSLARLMRPHQVEAATTLIGWLSGAPRIPALPSSSDDLWASASSCGRQEDSGAACDSGCHYQGAILADDMGLGKTLTAIAVLWTFLRSFTAKGVVVVPASIVGNWSNELKRWLSVRLVPLVLKTSKDIDTLSAFKSGHPAVTPLLIISYDLFRTHIAEINEVKSLDMIVLDEGHKFLKNAGTKTSAALARCRATKRLVLTGTPLQNNLSELHAVCSFVAPPSLLGALSTFNSRYAHTIAAGLKPGACTAATREANRTARALARKLDTIMIRRTADQVEGGHVPGRVRHDATILCRLSKEQHDIYEDLTRRCLSAFSDKMHVLVDGADSEQDEDSGAETDTHLVDACNPLSVMQRLRAICCSAADAPPSDETSLLNMSSKLTVLDHFLRTLQHRSPREKVVVVSNFTAALDHVQGLADARGYDTLRLDGRVPKDKRQGLVDRFNRPGDSSFLFLLSSKAGGMGINLIGGSRLVMLDCDWNPASDLQAMARIYRQGQQRDCFVYRLVAADTIDEAILSRQGTKRSLQAVMRGGSHSGASLPSEATVGLPKNLTASILEELFHPRRGIEGSCRGATVRTGIPHPREASTSARALDSVMDEALTLAGTLVVDAFRPRAAGVEGKSAQHDDDDDDDDDGAEAGTAADAEEEEEAEFDL